MAQECQQGKEHGQLCHALHGVQHRADQQWMHKPERAGYARNQQRAPRFQRGLQGRQGAYEQEEQQQAVGEVQQQVVEFVAPGLNAVLQAREYETEHRHAAPQAPAEIMRQHVFQCVPIGIGDPRAYDIGAVVEDKITGQARPIQQQGSEEYGQDAGRGVLESLFIHRGNYAESCPIKKPTPVGVGFSGTDLWSVYYWQLPGM